MKIFLVLILGWTSESSLFCESTENFLDLVLSYDYFQETSIQTEDGFFIKIFRFGQHPFGKPIVHVHGILDSADSFVTNKRPEANLGHLLTQAGYDIWLVNVRGSKYSCYHKNYEGDQPEFWDFSFHEIGKYDIPAVVDYVQKITGQKVILMGHSQGTSAIMAGLSNNAAL